jgi:ribosomal protein S15P/S13E
MKQEARTEVEGHYASERQSWRTELARAEQEVSPLREKIAAHEQREMKHEHEKAETERQLAEARQQWQAGSVENVASQLREKIAAQEAQIAAQAEQITSLDPHAQASLKDHRVKLQRAEDLVVSLREKIVLQDQQLQRLRRTSGTP